MSRTARMTASERREQLLAVGRSLFAHEGYEAVSVEEIAAKAGVSKPIVYEHFGGKEGLYAVIVDREMRTFMTSISDAFSGSIGHPSRIVEGAAMALLNYIEQNPDGFGVLVRDSPITDPNGSFSSLLGDVSTRVEGLLAHVFRTHGIPVKSAPYYAQMLVGMTIFVGQYWADRHDIDKETLAAYISNLAWNGLKRMNPDPHLRYEGSHTQIADDGQTANPENNLQTDRQKNPQNSQQSNPQSKESALPSAETENATEGTLGLLGTQPALEKLDKKSLKAEYKADKRRLKAEYKAQKHAVARGDAVQTSVAKTNTEQTNKADTANQENQAD